MPNDWKAVNRWRDYYAVSRAGLLKRTKEGRSTFVGRIVRGRPNDDGYVCVSLCRPGVQHHTKIHILVAEAFLGPRPTHRHEVNHKNGIKHDNRVENLEWVTPRENSQHARENGLWRPKRGEQNGRAKLTKEMVRWIRKQAANGVRHSDIAHELELRFHVQVSRVRIGRIVRRLAWTHLP